MGQKLSTKELSSIVTLTEGKLTKEDIKQHYDVFKKYAPKGKMDMTGLKLMEEDIKSLGCYCDSSAMMKIMDKNGDSQIEFNEYIMYIATTTSGAHPETLLQIAFDLYDADHNGFVTESEIREATNNIYATKGMNPTTPEYSKEIQERVKMILSLGDLSGDGKITKEEVLAAYRKNPEIFNWF